MKATGRPRVWSSPWRSITKSKSWELSYRSFHVTLRPLRAGRDLSWLSRYKPCLWQKDSRCGLTTDSSRPPISCPNRCAGDSATSPLNPQQSFFQRDSVLPILPLSVSVSQLFKSVRFKACCQGKLPNPPLYRAVHPVRCRIPDNPAHV